MAVIILTKDEERHIERAIDSVREIASRVYVVDSGSTDRTCELASGLGAKVLENPWVNHAVQFNWALGQLQPDDHWVLRLDADEILDSALRSSIAEVLSGVRGGFDAYEVKRRMAFLAKPIQWGGVFPIKIVRLFKQGRGQCEQRWMDEHIAIEGPAGVLDGELLDDNRNSLTWWIAKHNEYASREVVDILNAHHQFSESAFRGGPGRNQAVGEGARLQPASARFSRSPVCVLSGRHPRGRPGWAPRAHLPPPTGVLVPLLGGCEVAGGQDLYERSSGHRTGGHSRALWNTGRGRWQRLKAVIRWGAGGARPTMPVYRPPRTLALGLQGQGT